MVSPAGCYGSIPYNHGVPWLLWIQFISWYHLVAVDPLHKHGISWMPWIQSIITPLVAMEPNVHMAMVYILVIDFLCRPLIAMVSPGCYGVIALP